MKFSILQQDLLPALNSVSRSVGVHSSLPVLGNLLIATEGQDLKIAATNLEIGIIKYIKADISEPGEITIPAKTLVEIISNLGPVKVEVEVSNELVKIESGKFKGSITGISSSEFPVIPLAEKSGILFKKEVLKSCNQILFASAVDEGRPILTGILTEFNDSNLDFIATDGFRLAHRFLTLKDQKINFKSLIPRKTFEEIIRLLDEEEVDEVEINTSKNDNQAIFKIGRTVLSSRLIEGNFPSWEKIIPSKISTRSLIERLPFLQAIKLASVFAKSETNIINLSVSKDKFLIGSESKQLGSQTNEVEAQTEGDEIEIAFNVKFLLDILSAVGSSQIMVEFSGPLSAVLIKPVGFEGLEYILMPVKTS